MSYFGQSVLFLDYESGGRHLSEKQLEGYRLRGDKKVDEIFHAFREEGRPIQRSDDIVEMMESATGDSKSAVRLRGFRDYYSELPSWLDVDQLERGQRVFLSYLPAIAVSLYYRSLVPGFSIPKIAEVLLQTKYLAPPSSREMVQARLIDTGAMVALCMCKVEHLLPNQRGWKAAIRVRFLHAKVRHSLLARKTWKVEENGIPINQEDMAATLLAFSVNVLLGIEIVLRNPLSESDQKDYIALWRYIGWLLGVEVRDENPDALDPCGPGFYKDKPDEIAHSFDVFQSIILHLLRPNEASRKICHHLLQIGRSNENSSAMSNWYLFRALRCREFIGDPLADALHLPLHSTLYGRVRMKIFSSIYSFLLVVWTLAARPWSPIRYYMINLHRARLEKFCDGWLEPHLARMRDKTQKSCPFAMVTVYTE